MHLEQRLKAPQRFLLIAALLLCSLGAFLFAGTGVASAASVGARNTSAQPATSGGGCSTNPGYIEACISVNSVGEVEPDIYILHTSICNIYIELYEDGNVVSDDQISACHSAGDHLFGFATDATSGHTWWTRTSGQVEPHSPALYEGTSSPDQYT